MKAKQIPFNVPDSAFKKFRCSGCGVYDVSCWDKEGVEHWTGWDAQYRRIPDRVCGTWQLVAGEQQ